MTPIPPAAERLLQATRLRLVQGDLTALADERALRAFVAALEAVA